MMQLDVVPARTWSESFVAVDGIGPTCASCGTSDDLVLDETDPDEVVFCRECATPLCAIELADLYIDLGGGD
jgi:hypothetical protein